VQWPAVKDNFSVYRHPPATQRQTRASPDYFAHPLGVNSERYSVVEWSLGCCDRSAPNVPGAIRRGRFKAIAEV
jgi:hypothetical protein